MMQQVNKLFQQGGMGHVKEWKGVQYSHHGYMHPRNAGGKRNSQPSTEGDLPEEGSCNEIGQGTLAARSRRGERTSRSTLVPKNNGVFEPNNDPNQKDSILKSGQEVTNEGEHDIYGRYALGRYGSKLLHSTYRIGDEDNTHGTKWESISDDPYDLVLLTQGEVLEG